MKKSMVLFVLIGGLTAGSLKADFAGAITEGTATYKQAINFKKNIDSKYSDIKKQVALIKTQKGGQKGQTMTIVLDDGLGMMDDVSSILLSVIATLAEAMDAIPSDKTKPIADQLYKLLYADDAAKDEKSLTGPVGSVINVIKLMKSITAQLKTAADKAATSQAAAGATGSGASATKPQPQVAKDDLLEL